MDKNRLEAECPQRRDYAGAVLTALCTVPALVAGVGVGAALAGGTMFGSSGVLFRGSLLLLAIGAGAALRWQWAHEPAFRVTTEPERLPRCETCKVPVLRRDLALYGGLCMVCYAAEVAFLVGRAAR